MTTLTKSHELAELLGYETSATPQPGRPEYTLLAFPTDTEKAPKRFDFQPAGNDDASAKQVAAEFAAQLPPEQKRLLDLYESTKTPWRKVR